MIKYAVSPRVLPDWLRCCSVKRPMKSLLFCLLLLTVTGAAQAQYDLFSAARTGDLATLKQAHDAKANLDTTDARGFTPLILAVYNNQPDAAAYLLGAGASTAIADGSGNTALMGACFRGYLPMVKLLLTHRAAINQVNRNGASALIFASTFGHADIVRYLLEQKADTSLHDSRGYTALDHARMQENPEIIALLGR